MSSTHKFLAIVVASLTIIGILGGAALKADRRFVKQRPFLKLRDNVQLQGVEGSIKDSKDEIRYIKRQAKDEGRELSGRDREDVENHQKKLDQLRELRQYIIKRAMERDK